MMRCVDDLCEVRLSRRARARTCQHAGGDRGRPRTGTGRLIRSEIRCWVGRDKMYAIIIMGWDGCFGGERGALVFSISHHLQSFFFIFLFLCDQGMDKILSEVR